jgi:trigger factor
VKTEVKRINPTRVKLTITVDQQSFKPALDRAYKTVSEQVNIPGFRKGKVPAAVLDQRVGKDAIIGQAINDGLDIFYRDALREKDLRPLDTPQADIKSAPSSTEPTKELVVELEVEVEPEFEMPSYKGMKVSVEAIKIAQLDVDTELDALRARFGTLRTVDRAAQMGDFTTIDLSASIDSNPIDAASDISYEIGSNQLLDGIDEALDTLTSGESTTFRSKLVGGEFAGKEAEVAVTLKAVKERELPELNDEFAQLASEFDTLAELRADVEQKIEKQMARKQILQARDRIVDELVKLAKIPTSQVAIEREVHSHLEGEGRLQDNEHRKEVTEEAEKNFQTRLILDAVVKGEQIKVQDKELVDYLALMATSYGMNPNDFIKQISNAGQVPAYVSELARRKAVDFLVANAEISDTSGKKVEYQA